MRALSSLKRALTVNFLLVASLPTLLFGLLAISVMQDQLLDEIRDRNMLKAQSVADEADSFLYEVMLDLRLVADVIGSQQVVDPRSLDDYLQLVVRNSQFFESIFLLDAEKRIMQLGLMPQLSARRGDYRGLDLSAHEIFKDDEELQGPVWSGTFVSLVTGRQSVTLALPLERGVLFGNISLERLGQLLSSYAERAKQSAFAIIDREGTLVAHSNDELAVQRINFSAHPTIDAAIEGRFTTSEYRDGQNVRLESVAPVAIAGWVVWVSLDMDAVMQPVQNLRNLLVAFMVGGVALASALALLNVRRLMLPLISLEESTDQIAGGDYDFTFRPSGFSEIDRVAEKFADMSRAIMVREDSIIESEQRFRDLVNSIDGVVWELDLTAERYLFVSRQAEALFGYPLESWLDESDFWYEHLHPADREAARRARRSGRESGEKFTCEYRMYRVDGEVRWVKDLITIIRSGAQPERLLGVMIDITDRKVAEEELSRYRTHLEELVAERTAQLERAQAELVHTERLAVLGQLTATVSHEIRNPLGTIANALYLVRHALPETDLDRLEKPLAIAERNVDRCNNIIGELLDFSRQRDIQAETFAIDPWLAETLDEVVWPDQVEQRRMFASGSVVLADPEQLRRALVNVLTNSLHAVAEKDVAGGQVEIEARTRNGRCEIIVRDNGVGIPGEVLEKIYEPMFSTKNFGVGLGVPIVRNVLRAHGGDVHYESRPGEGTIVTMWLPL